MSDTKSSEYLKYIQAPIQCDDCEDYIDVKWYCNTCSASLCNTCKVRKIHRKHEVFDYTEGDRCGSRMLSLSCDIHKGKKVKTYCQDHEKPCCSDCLKHDHHGHKIIDIEDAYKENKMRLNDFIEKLEKQTIPTSLRECANLEEKLKSNSTYYDNEKVKINKFREELKIKVDQICDNHLMNVDQALFEYQLQYCHVIQHWVNRIDEFKKLIAEIRMKIRAGGLDIMKYYPTISKGNIQSPPEPKHIEFQPRRDCIEVIGKYIEGLRAPDSTDVRPDINVQMSREFKTNICARSIAPTSNGDAWISFWGNDTMYLYDIYGSMKTSLVGEKGSPIWDITLTKGGDIIVANKDGCVRKVTTTGEVSYVIDTKPYSPQGVCVTDKDEIVVCMAGQIEKIHMAIYSSDGKSKLHEIKPRDQKRKLILTDPARVTMTGDIMHVMNLKQNVVTMDVKENVMWVYDASNANTEHSFEPLGLSGDKKGNVLISDYGNHCVHFVNGEGHLIQILMSQDHHGIEYPFGIGFDEDKLTIWLGNAIESTAKIWIANHLH